MSIVLSDIEVSSHYESNENLNIVNEFYLPTLSEANRYRRVIGHFFTESLIVAAKGLVNLISNNGEMLMITTPRLTDQDINRIKENPHLKGSIISARLAKDLKQIDEPFAKARLNTIARLVENDQLKIKIAVPKDISYGGIQYELFGIVEDQNANKISFTYQVNDRAGEYYRNYKTIDVFCSWNAYEEIRVKSKEEYFTHLWTGQNAAYDIMELPVEVKDKLLSYRIEDQDLMEPEVDLAPHKSCISNFPIIPSYIQIREYQQEAIKNWFRNSCQGLLEMATGTGKTITALSAAAKLWEVTNRLGVIIVCPYTHLVDQWVEDIKLFNMSPIVAYQSRNLWEEILFNEISAFRAGITNHFCLITTNATFSSNSMQNLLTNLGTDVLFIADEAHHLGARKNRESLLQSIPYRLALSATPNRWHDDEGTKELINYFGGSIVFQYGLDKAIGNFLTEYYYYPHIVYLDDDESDYYFEITKKIAKLFYLTESVEENESLQSLLIERSRILSRARNKLSVLKELMSQKRDSHFNIIYCGDSQVDGEKQIDAVVNLLGTELDMNVHTFTSREDKEERQQLLQRFENGDLQALVAIKCLDEGVDVPATQTAYILSSSTNPREFIQRRGRVLRKHKNKKYSYIHDFIVIPRRLEELEAVDASVFNIERNMIKRELIRFSEFADLAINGPLAHEKLNKIKHSYHLLDI